MRERKSSCRWLGRVAVTIVLVLGAVATLAIAIASADEGTGAQTQSATVLQPTQVIAEIPDEHGQLFQVRWGGGSLLQLKGRLATMGCIANTIWIYNNEQWHAYNQYDIPQSNPVNQAFKTAYETLVPKGAHYVDCYNICEFGGNSCISHGELREKTNNFNFNVFENNPLGGPFQIDDIPCGDEYLPITHDLVLPILPIRPDTCIIKKDFKDGKGVRGVVDIHTVNTPPFIVIGDDNSNTFRTRTEYDTARLKIEIHELCHINQNWHWVQQLEPGSPDDYRTRYGYWQGLGYFYDSEHGMEFAEIVGYNDDIRNVPWDSVWRAIYRPDLLTELAAELCAEYILDRVGERSSYDYRTWTGSITGLRRVPIREIDVNTFLTPEVRDWLETYMILPSLAE